MIEGLTFDDVQIIPKYSTVESRYHCDTTSELVKGVELKIPVVSSPMDTVTEWEMVKELNRLGATGILHRFMPKEELLKNIRNIGKTSEPKIIAVGTKDFLDIIESTSGVNIVLIDIAHGHSIHTERVIKSIKNKYPNIKVIAGNISTADAAVDLVEWGADALRVGIGNGSLCETRIRTGVGVPQFTAIRLIYLASLGVPIIADGGIRTPGDVAKAIAAGADTVMLGSLLAGTKESPGKLVRQGLFPDEQLFKLYRGSASLSAKIDREETDEHIEGNSKQIPYKGKVKRIIEAIEDGLKSSMSYVGARNLKEFRKNAEFIKVTYAGQIEAQPHLLIK